VSLFARGAAEEAPALRPFVLGHRGGRGEGWPAENTLEAFARALEEGAAGVELDVRTCATGEAVVFHDADLGRMTRGEDTRPVAKVPLRELVRVRLAGGLRVPTLAETLEWAKSRCAVNVELKRDVPSRDGLARAVGQEVRSARADVLLSSFDAGLLSMVRGLAPRTPRGLLISPDAPPVVPRLDIRAVHFERTHATAQNVAHAKERGLAVGVWTVNEADEARKLLRLGVSWLISDGPGVVAAALS
jgi:glycerophosphoryl diester phosphodiesterase